MKKLDALKIGVGGTDYYFNENEQLVEFLQDLYPRFKFQATLSLSPFPQRNLHQLEVVTPTGPNLTYDSLPVQDAIVEGLLGFLDKTHEDMHRRGIKSATVHLSRINLGASTDSFSLKTRMYAHLRACFIPD
ncbi:predicted ORF [Xanthomonas phage XacN1]|jgi:hypothetical protein|nr:predicted ORF [Xanthomonas phage XacN1]